MYNKGTTGLSHGYSESEPEPIRIIDIPLSWQSPLSLVFELQFDLQVAGSSLIIYVIFTYAGGFARFYDYNKFQHTYSLDFLFFFTGFVVREWETPLAQIRLRHNHGPSGDQSRRSRPSLILTGKSTKFIPMVRMRGR